MSHQDPYSNAGSTEWYHAHGPLSKKQQPPLPKTRAVEERDASETAKRSGVKQPKDLDRAIKSYANKEALASFLLGLIFLTPAAFLHASSLGSPWAALGFVAIAAFGALEQNVNSTSCKRWRVTPGLHWSSVRRTIIPLSALSPLFISTPLIYAWEVAREPVNTDGWSRWDFIQQDCFQIFPYIGIVWVFQKFVLLPTYSYFFPEDLHENGPPKPVRGHRPLESHADYADKVGGSIEERDCIMQAAKNHRLMKLQEEQERISKAMEELNG